MVESPRVERVLALTRAHFRAAPAARERVRGRLMARGELGQPAPGSSLLAGRGAAGIAKSTVALLVGVSFITGFWLGGQRASERALDGPSRTHTPNGPSIEPAPADAHVPPAVAQAQARASGTDAEQGRASAPARETAAAQRPHTARHGARSPHSAPEPDSALSQELALLQRAERAIRSGEPDLALSFLDDLERRYPDTRFVEERTAARLMARCARRDPGVEAQAELFLRDRRRSVYSDRVSALCGLEPAPDARDGNSSLGH